MEEHPDVFLVGFWCRFGSWQQRAPENALRFYLSPVLGGRWVFSQQCFLSEVFYLLLSMVSVRCVLQ